MSCFSEMEMTRLSFLNDALIAAPQISGLLTLHVLRTNPSQELREAVTALADAFEEEACRDTGAWNFGRLLLVAERLCKEDQPRHIRTAGRLLWSMVEGRMPQPIVKPTVIQTTGENPSFEGLRAAAAAMGGSRS